MELSGNEREKLLQVLEMRFNKNMHRHKDLSWDKIQSKLESNEVCLWSLNEMEKTGGEPDVIDYDSEKDNYIFCDCSKESPKGRRSVCYDQKALEERKKFKPKNSAQQMAKAMGIQLLTEKQYKTLQELENFDTKTSSWIATPDEIRDLGGALFGDFRFGKTFIYHNGAESYYAARGFRGLLRV